MRSWSKRIGHIFVGMVAFQIELGALLALAIEYEWEFGTVWLGGVVGGLTAGVFLQAFEANGQCPRRAAQDLGS